MLTYCQVRRLAFALANPRRLKVLRTALALALLSGLWAAPTLARASCSGQNCTLFPASATPAVADSGPDSAVELGVKFESATAATVTGIRFYKGAGNTGTHVGNLWSAGGALLATVTFQGESASGWQQANFTTPVAIAANTVYVASYHTSVGHYSDDQGYFASAGVSSPPLSVPADGASGPNGVFAYGSSSTFPTGGWNSSNYWVDVAVTTATLQSITLSPSNPSVSTGSSEPFAALGTYSDGSNQTLTSGVTWASSNTSIATIGASGTATALAPGTTTISATSGSVVGTTTLTVQAAPLTFNTTSLPAGALGMAYSAQLVAAGGLLPYAFSVQSGSLPPGLSLTPASGLISGSPTTAGTFSFLAKVTDSSSASATAALSITVAATSSYTLWPSTTVPSLVDSGPDNAVELGVKFRSDSAGYVTAIRFYKAATNTGTHVGNLWTSSGTLLASATFSNETASGWQQAALSTPVAVTAGTVYVVSYHTSVGHYSDTLNYFATAGVDSPPLHALANGVSGVNGVYAYGAASAFPSLGYQSSNYWVDLVLSATPPATLASIAVAPAQASLTAGATQQFTATGTYSDGSTQNLSSSASWSSSSTGVASVNASGLATALSPGTATISAALSGVTGTATLTVKAAPLTVTTTSLPNASQGVAYSSTLSASGGLPPYVWSIPSGLPPGLALNASTGTLSGTPSQVGVYGFTATVTDSQHATASGSFSITVSASPPATYTIFTSTATPTLADAGPDSAVELGVKFRADVNGVIQGIRFYKSSANTGTHIGNLWSSSGTLLASATFTGETATGWQQVNFPVPVAVAANTVYVASYHATSGHYAADQNYFASAGVDRPPLHALADGVSGSDGAYAYGATSTFPSSGYRASNYWVDVVFAASSGVASLVSIAISPASSSLALGATGQFSAIGTYSDGSTADISTSATWASANPTVATVSSSGLVRAMSAGTASLSASFSGFTGNATVTVPLPPPLASFGPGGPILIVSSSGYPLSSYYAQILLAEGLNEFSGMDIASVTSSVLAGYDLVLLADLPLTSAEAQLLSSWVTTGGKLIAMHPDPQLAGLLGLKPTGAALPEGYLLVNTSSPPGAGIVGQTVQYHGSANLYTLAGAAPIATLYSSASAATSYPAVTLANAGLGLAAAFTYDLARSVVYTRQGNPAWSGERRDGSTDLTRADNLFYGPATFDPEPNWVDMNKVAIPQADEQQRLLANLILTMNLAERPLPRFWYLPSGFKAAVVMTGDDHSPVYETNGGTAGRFTNYIAQSAPGCSVADWQCIRSTSNVYPNSSLTDAQAQTFLAQGFEVALHVTTNCLDYTSYADLDSDFTTQLAAFAPHFPSVPAPQTNRTHCIAWSDYDSEPKVELAHGIRFDTNYYYWPPAWVNDVPGLFTGSGFPMRFTDIVGETLDVYQATTQMTDESGQSYPMTIQTLLNNAVGPSGYYGVFTANMHTDQVASTGSDAIVAAAQALGVPVVSSLQMLEWLDARNASSFASIAFSGNVLTFEVTTAARNIQAMIPASVGSLNLSSVSSGGAPVAFTTQAIKGITYAFFPVTTATYQAAYR